MAVEQFLERLSQQAMAMREAGDMAGLNALTADPSIRDYVNNVVFNPAMNNERFAYWYKDKWAHLGVLAEQYEQAERNKERVETLEEKLDKLMLKFNALLETQTAKQKKAVAEAEAEAVDDDAEADADADNAQTDEKPDEDDAEAEAPPANDAEGDKPEVEED